ncbi:MAG: hypothetical protein FVQ79_09580 [Planctomycetes bacterium]|nr:hypothetical protein [Planctomycetota bacterium]
MKMEVKIIIISVFAFFAGCAPLDLSRVDQGAELAITATEQGEMVINSQLGVLIPPQIAVVLKLAGAAVVAAALSWQEFRRRTANTAITEIVRGVEDLKHAGQGDRVSNAMNAEQGDSTKKLVKLVRAAL